MMGEVFFFCVGEGGGIRKYFCPLSSASSLRGSASGIGLSPSISVSVSSISVLVSERTSKDPDRSRSFANDLIAGGGCGCGNEGGPRPKEGGPRWRSC